MTRHRLSIKSAQLIVAALLLLAIAPARAEVLVKMGTRAPEGSAWHLVLKEMGEKWREVSGGQVVLRIYPNGVAGDEPDMVRQLRIGKLHAAALTIVGLSLLSPESQALSTPMMLTRYDELDYVREKLTPKLEAKLREKGIVVLNWGDAGWLQFFSTKPAASPEEMRKLKMFVWTGDGSAVDIWKDAGFRPVPLASTDIVPALQTGLVEAIPTTALIAESAQLFTTAKYMVALNWAPLVGATVINAAKWEEIPAEVRPKLLDIARSMGERFRNEVRKLDDAAVEAMKKRGLTVSTATPEAAAEWRRLAEQAYPRLRTEVFDAATFDEVKALRDEFRARKGAAPSASPAAAMNPGPVASPPPPAKPGATGTAAPRRPPS